MSFLARRRAAKSLSPEGRQLVDDHRLHATHPMEEWRRLFDELSEYEREASESIAGRFDLFVVPFIRVLEQDVPPGREVTLQIDLRSPTEWDKSAGERPMDMTGTVYNKGEEQWYYDRWFSGEASLAGGSKLQWSVMDRLRKRVLHQRSSSGRAKSKSKLKSVRFLEVNLSVPSDRWNAAELESPAAWMKVKADFEGKRYEISGKTHYALEHEDPGTELHRLLLAISQLYRYASPAVQS